MKPKRKIAKKKTGRPTKRTPAVIRRICEGLAKGRPMTLICEPDSMPDPSNVWEWAQKDQALSEAIARARAVGFDAIAQAAMDIADDPEEDVQRSKLRIETRLKLLAKWDPKRYGDKIDVEHKGTVDIEITIGGDDAE